MTRQTALFRFRIVMIVFIVGLIISGVTAFPLLAELKLLTHMLGIGEATSPIGYHGLSYWLLTIRFGLEDMYGTYPWIAYGTDWLAFGHIVIALFFIGPLIHPEQGRHVIYVGLAACALVFPLALICGPIRGIPFYWQLVDCSFGLCGAVPLVYCLRLLRSLELTAKE